MKVFHYVHENDDTNYHHSLTKDFGDTCTDKTFYRPSLDSLRSTLGASPRTGLYDFSDGKDTGERYQPIIRNPGIDITEVNQILDNITNVITEKKSVDKEKLQSEIDKAKASLESKKSESTETVETSSKG